MVRIRLLGTMSIEIDGAPLSGRSTQRRRLALIALLAIAGRRGISRDKLLAYLWPDSTTEQARHSLSQAVYAIRSELGENTIVMGIDELRLDPAAVVSDVDDFQAALAAGDPGRAIESYGGPFLDGFFIREAPEFGAWVDSERARLAGAFAAALEKRAADLSRGGDPARAVGLWQHRAALDPLNSRVTLRLMEALAECGDRAGALRHAEIHCTLLRNEVGADPDQAVISLADRIRAESRKIPPAIADAARPGESSARAERQIVSLDPALLTEKADGDTREHELQRGAGFASQIPWTRQNRVTVSLAALFVTVLLVAGSRAAFTRRADAAEAGPHRVLLGAISTTDDTFGIAVREALRAELETADEIRLTSDGKVREILRLMRVGADTPLTSTIAVDVARRVGVPLVITGSATSLGTGAQLIAQLIDARSGETVATFAERPESEADILHAVTRISRELRKGVSGMGGPAAALDPLPAVTTASLPALRNYVLARQALARLDRRSAIDLGEVALVYDSTFALAHYLLADLLWYVDQQTHSDQHMQRAFDLSGTLPPREQLVVKARYQLLVRDRLDSSLVYWQLLQKSFPEEPLAYEGLRWTYRALGETTLMARADESAYRYDPTTFPAFVDGRMTLLMSAGDTSGAYAFARSVSDRLPHVERAARVSRAWAEQDPARVLGLVDTADSYQRHVALLAMGRPREAALELKNGRAKMRGQFLPRALLLQARAELAPGGSRLEARTLVRATLDWLRAADLSAPANARLVERTADVAGRIGDLTTLNALQSLLLAKDRGRNLPSYERALTTVRACTAFARGDFRVAADLAAAARPGMFYGRSVATIVMLEADARAISGDTKADSLYHEVLTQHAFVDGDEETLAVLRWFAARVGSSIALNES